MGDRQKDATARQGKRDVLRAVDQNRFLIAAVASYGLCRCFSALPFGPCDLRAGMTLWGDLGKIFGIILCIACSAIARKAGVSERRAVFAFAGLSALGVLVSASSGFVGGRLCAYAVGCARFLVGLGSTALLLQCLDLISRVSMKSIVVALAGAEFLNSWVSLTIDDGVAVEPIAVLLLTVVTCLLVYCVWGKSFLGARRPTDVGECPRRAWCPWRLVLWAGVYCFAYGLVTTYTGMTVSSFSNDMGNMMPCAAILLMALLVNEYFDLNILKSTALVFMVAGLAIVGVMGVKEPWVQLLANAGASSCRLFAYSLACMRAHAIGVPAMAVCGVVKAVIIVATRVGFTVGLAGLPADMGVQFTLLTLVVTLLGVFVSPFSVDDRHIMERVFHAPDLRVAEQKLETLGRRFGLSRRELTVLALIVKGFSATEISSQLFISKGAVRSHQSRIYSKFSVHSQQELVDTIYAEMPNEANRLRASHD